MTYESNLNQLPLNIEAEQALLGAMLFDNTTAAPVQAILRSTDFSEPLHSEIYQAVGQVMGEGRVADPVTLANRFADYEAIVDGLTVPKYIGRLAASATTTIHAPDYARTVRDLAMRRRLISIGDEIATAARSPTTTVIETCGAIVSDIDDLLARAVDRRSSLTLVEAAREVMDHIASDDGSNRISTGLATLDNAIGGGLPRGGLAIAAGRPSMGKTAFATAIMIQAAMGGAGVLKFSLEMTREAVAARCLSNVTCTSTRWIPYSKAMDGTLDESEREVWGRAILKMDQLPIIIDDQRGLTIAEIGARVRAAKQRMERNRESLDLVIVDHLGLVKPTGRYAGSKVNETGEISDALCTLAKKENVALLALHQLNRATDARDNKRPTLVDLRNSGDVEQDADLVMFPYREGYYLEREKHPDNSEEECQRLADLESYRNSLEIQIAKNRNGPVGNVALWVDMACNVIRDVKAELPPA